ncbi:conserved hypothetical protein [Methylobacterium sp. 4-46]|uniref:hypothetical protein n=1 Tax=unclassified Methylobacterium TaxID=2615210 RepID=UPI000152D6DE|nr:MULTISPECIES: hypothetical protein [Methylobacterium]ACA16574.1 conserved hypothetical protein [Methylobacterium sp. 4-46]WFT82281.1 hypothetical protein QA634_10705 [Methylobacterium nodulans]
MLPRLLLCALLAALACLVEARAQAPVRNVLPGTCETLVLGGRDASATCANELVNGVEGRRTIFEFRSSDGNAVAFSGTGAPQERQEEFGVDATQPVSVLILTSKGPDGAVLRDTLMTVGSCRFPPAEPGTSRVVCAADTQRGRFEGVFVTRAGAKP